MPNSDKFILSFVPSVEEIQEDPGENLYLRDLTGFYKSIDQLLEQFQSLFFESAPAERNEIPVLEWHTGVGYSNGQEVVHAFPPEVAQLTMLISGSGISVYAYKLLKSWIDYKKGRKVYLRLGSFDLETNNIEHSAIKGILKEAMKADRENRIAYIQMLKKEGFTLKDITEMHKESLLINSAINNKKSKKKTIKK